MRIALKNKRQIAATREAGMLVADTFAMIAEHIKPGVALRELDHLAEAFILSALEMKSTN